MITTFFKTAPEPKEDFSGLTEEQIARIKKSKEEALAKKRARETGIIRHLTEDSWRRALAAELRKPSTQKLFQRVQAEYDDPAKTVYPPMNDIWTAFNLTPFSKVRVVILGQDPYHGPNQAMGLSFAVRRPTRPPPSLVNIYKELKTEFGEGFNIPNHGDLTPWSEQGVLMLNSSLSVRQREAGSHSSYGWDKITDAAIRALSDQRTGLVFMCWGRHAKERAARVDKKKHTVLMSAHPSPYSADNGFFGNNHFKSANEALKSRGAEPIDGSLPQN